MTRTRDTQVFDRDDEVKIAFGRALGLSYEKLAEICDSSRSNVHAVAQLDKVKRLEALARAVISQDEARSVEKVRDSFTDRMRNGFSRALGVTERAIPLVEQLLTLAEAKGDQNAVGDLMPILAELRLFHNTYTAFFARYQVSEAPKRTQVEGLVRHDVKHTLSLADARNIIETGRQIESAFVKPPIDVTPSN